jgi:hypothetical protein
MIAKHVLILCSLPAGDVTRVRIYVVSLEIERGSSGRLRTHVGTRQVHGLDF